MTSKLVSSCGAAVEAHLRALFVRSLNGDTAAYHAFLDALTGVVRAFLRKRLLHLRDDLEDVAQDVLLAVHNARHTYRDGEPLTAWVYAIARYKLTDFLRARSRREALHDPLDDDFACPLQSDTDAVAIRRDLDTLLGHLPERQRRLIVYTKLEGRSVAETADLTGLSEAAIKVGVHRGLRTLTTKISAAASAAASTAAA